MSQRPAFARRLTAAARVLMGLVFFVFGLNGFLHFIPQPPELPPFAEALVKTGYMFPMIAGTQVLVGAMLLLNRFVALALVLIAPVVVNIVAFHIFLEPNGTVIALVVLALESYLVWSYRHCYRGLLDARASSS
jgi:uncharacterized membrane protein YphA (DoxX/SURF4 family)